MFRTQGLSRQRLTTPWPGLVTETVHHLIKDKRINASYPTGMKLRFFPTCFRKAGRSVPAPPPRCLEIALLKYNCKQSLHT